MAMINATFQEKKSLWSIAYKVSNLNQVEIIDITYLNADFNGLFYKINHEISWFTNIFFI